MEKTKNETKKTVCWWDGKKKDDESFEISFKSVPNGTNVVSEIPIVKTSISLSEETQTVIQYISLYSLIKQEMIASLEALLNNRIKIGNMKEFSTIKLEAEKTDKNFLKMDFDIHSNIEPMIFEKTNKTIDSRKFFKNFYQFICNEKIFNSLLCLIKGRTLPFWITEFTKDPLTFENRKGKVLLQYAYFLLKQKMIMHLNECFENFGKIEKENDLKEKNKKFLKIKYKSEYFFISSVSKYHPDYLK